MLSKTQKLTQYIKGLEIKNTTKQSLLKRLEKEAFSNELFVEIDQILQKELNLVESELENLNQEFLDKQAELQELKEKNLPKKQALKAKHRAGLKVVFDEAVIEGKKIAGEVDTFLETEQSKQEAENLDEIRKKLAE